ncbi:MAG: DNRLRE domain-containing protein, partial [Candidatus Fimenecus sp.]
MKKGIKLFCKILSVFLSILLVIQIAPMQVIADAYNTNPDTEASESTENFDTSEATVQEETQAEIIAEETSKREENVKHFRMSDGSYVAAQYDVPVHFMQNGEWTDYDNTLVEVDADEEENNGNVKNKDLTNISADYSVRLSKKTNGKKFVRIEKDGYKLSWYYTNAAKSDAQICENTDDGDKSTLEKLASRVIYEKVYNDTDFEYIIGSGGLKENIILNSNTAQTVFTAEYKANGLTPVQTDSKTVELQADNGTVIYTISAPFMTDADGNASDGVTLTLSNVKNNSFTVTTTLDGEWITEEDRTFPVTVDPMVKTKPDTATIQNKYITTNNYNLTATGSMYVGNQKDLMCVVRSAVKFTALPSLDRGDMVCGATVNLAQLKYDHVSNTELQINAYEITSAWSGFSASTAGVCSSTDPTHASTVLDYVITTSSNNYHQISWDVTPLVKKWYNGGQNNGILFRASDDRWACVQLVSKYNNIQNGKPVLFVSYINNEGLEDYWSYTEQSLGGGTGYVNNYTGNLVVNVPICDTGSASLPASISYYYNGYQAGRHFAVTQGGGVYNASKSICGAGWKLNVDEQLSYLTPGVGNNDDLHANGFKYTYTDADGTVLYMKQDSSNSNVFHDELGKGYTLTLRSEGGWELTDKQNNKKIFTGGGRLLSVQSNQSQDKITYTYNANNFLTKITDGSGHTITIGRNENNA